MRYRFICLSLFSIMCAMIEVYAVNPFKYHRDSFHRHEFGLSIGVVDRTKLYRHNDSFVRNTSEKLQIEGYIFDDYLPALTLNGHYSYHPNDRLGIGASAGWTSMPGQNSLHYSDSKHWEKEGLKDASASARTFFAMPTIQYKWLQNRHISMYSRGGIGAYYCHRNYTYWERDTRIEHDITEDKFLFAYQVTALGVDFSNGPVRFFMEAGYGAEGVFKIGISAHLGRACRK